MRVVQLTAENFKRLKAVDITPDGDTVVISGPNAAGKSSVLDAIWAALGGKQAPVEHAIRNGAENAYVTLDLQDLIVTRTWKANGSSQLVVKSQAGARFPSPQKILDELTTRFAFDPLAFANADDKTQAKILADAVGLDLERFTQSRREAYDQRTVVNREVRRLEGSLAKLPDVPLAETPDEPVNVGALAQTVAQLNEDLRRKAELMARYASLQAEMERVMIEGRQVTERLGENPEQRLEDAKLQLNNADRVNQNVQTRRRRIELAGEMTVLRAESEKFTEIIKDVDERKQRAIESAALPVPGLGFGEEGVELNGVPFSQASAAERLRTSAAIGIALAKPQGVRVMTIRDGSLLDSSNMAILEQMAAENDFQIWVERVDETGTVGVVIEDGEVRSS